MLTIICIYYNFTIINIMYLHIFETADFAKTRYVDEMHWVLLGWVIGEGLSRVRTSDKASARRLKEAYCGQSSTDYNTLLSQWKVRWSGLWAADSARSPRAVPAPRPPAPRSAPAPPFSATPAQRSAPLHSISTRSAPFSLCSRSAHMLCLSKGFGSFSQMKQETHQQMR